MMTQDVTQPGEIWFLTADDSEKAHDLAEEQAVNASYADPQHGRYVSITGRGTISHNHEKLHELWDDAFTEFFPKGLDDPHLALLRVQIETAEFWDSHTGRMQSLHDESPSDSARGQGEPDKHAADNTEHTQIDIRAMRASG